MHLNPQFILRTIADEAILISIQDISAPKKLLMLNELGSDIYSLLQEGKSEQDIHEILLQQYDVEASVLENDIQEFLSELIRHGVLVK